MAVEKGYAAATGAQQRLNKGQRLQGEIESGLPETPFDHDSGIDISEAHFDPISVTRIELWFGDRALPTWNVPTNASGGPPDIMSLRIGDAVQFRVAVFDVDGKARWASVAQLLPARPRFEFEFIQTGIYASILEADSTISGLFKAVLAGATPIFARLTLGGSVFDSQTITVTIV